MRITANRRGKQRRFRPFFEQLEARDVPAVHGFIWNPPANAGPNGLNWSIASNWLDEDTQMTATRAPGIGTPLGDFDSAEFINSNSVCFLDQTLTIGYLNMARSYIRTLFLQHTLTVIGIVVNGNKSAGELAGGVIDVGDWSDESGVHPAGNLVYAGTSAVAYWGALGPAGPGTMFPTRSSSPLLLPARWSSSTAPPSP